MNTLAPTVYKHNVLAIEVLDVCLAFRRRIELGKHEEVVRGH